MYTKQEEQAMIDIFEAIRREQVRGGTRTLGGDAQCEAVLEVVHRCYEKWTRPAKIKIVGVESAKEVEGGVLIRCMVQVEE